MSGLSFFRIIPVIVILVCQTGYIYAEQSDPSATLYQISSFDLFSSGNYSEVVSVNDMKDMGTLGIGGAEDLDGELIEVDGKVWQITSDGMVSEPSGDTGVCFGNTIRFEPSISYLVNKTQDYKELLQVVNNSFPDHNSMYAFRIDGKFSKMKVRSVPLQEEPYPPLSEVIENQTIFNLSGVSGTISGFWYPEWIQGVNLAGFHPHFITENHDAGGHVLDFIAENVTISIQPVHRFTMILSPGDDKKS